MNAFDYDAVVYDGDIYCLYCLPDDASEDDYNPIFADSEWSQPPICSNCQEVHHYVKIVFPKQTLVSKTKKEYILQGNGFVLEKISLNKVAELYWDEGELYLRILEKIKKERFKKPVYEDEVVQFVQNINDASNYLE